MITEEDLYYVAGLLDARCTVLMVKSSSGNRMAMQVQFGGSLPVLRYLHDNIGGNVVGPQAKEYLRHKCLEHCEEAHKIIFRMKANWRIRGSGAAILLYNVKPYMLGWTTKMEEHYQQELLSRHKWSQDHVLSLKARGWNIP